MEITRKTAEKTTPVTQTKSADTPSVIARFIKLQKRIRAVKEAAELAFVIVNDTKAVVPYRQAVLWCRESGSQRGRIEALSGVAEPMRSGVFATWLEPVLTRTAEALGEKTVGTVVPSKDDLSEWKTYLPARGLFVRLPKKDDKAPDVGAVFFRDAVWSADDALLLTGLAELWADEEARVSAGSVAWEGRTSVTGRWRTLLAVLRKRAVRWGIVAGCAAAAFIPVTQSVLAPGEVVASDAFSVRAPMAGVVEQVFVRPNESVQKGQLLARMDVQELRGRLEAARQTATVAAAELRQGRQQAFFDERSKMGLGVLTSRAEQAAADVKYLEGELQKTEIRADRDGVAVLTDADEWQGRPVAVGERILTVADPRKTEIEFNIAVGDAVELPQKASVRFFLNAEPLSPVEGQVSYVAYRATPSADGTLAYRGRASVSEDGAGRLTIGLKGTAKVYGERTFLIVYLLRRPLSSLRLWLGL